jgi:hypothetical protein
MELAQKHSLGAGLDGLNAADVWMRRNVAEPRQPETVRIFPVRQAVRCSRCEATSELSSSLAISLNRARALSYKL